ncbi:MAG: hypothetical protein WBR29_03025 [Gammaproteobacteria bacterium]
MFRELLSGAFFYYLVLPFVLSIVVLIIAIPVSLGMYLWQKWRKPKTTEIDWMAGIKDKR